MRLATSAASSAPECRAHGGAEVEARPSDDLKTLPLPRWSSGWGPRPTGSPQAEAQKRLAQYGPNEIEEKKANPLLKFLTYFWGPIPWMIEAAVILSGVLRHWPDFFIILVLLLPTPSSDSARSTRPARPSTP